MMLNVSALITSETFTDMQTLNGLRPSGMFLPTIVSMCLLALVVISYDTLFRIKKLPKLFSVVDFGKAKDIKGVPTVTTFTILKGLFQFRTDLPSLFNLLTQKHGEIFNISLLGIYNVVIIFNPSMVKKLFMSNEPGHLQKPKWYNKVLGGALREGLFVSKPNVWKLHRSIVSWSFTYQGLLHHLNIFEEHAKRFVLNLQESCDLSTYSNKSSMSFEKEANMITYDIICHMAAGKELHDLKQEEKLRFQNNFLRIKDIIAYRVSHPLYYMDFIWNFSPQKREMDKIFEEINDSTHKVVSGIRKHLDANTVDGLTKEDDMNGKSLVELKVKAGLTNEQIFAETMTFFAAGHDAVTSNLNILMFLLASHKEYQDKCREDIDQMFEKINLSNSNEISMEHLKGLTFVDMCIKESLRLYPTVSLFGRELESPIQLDERTYLPPKSIVLTSSWMIQRNPKIYSEPEKFHPERFSRENVKNIGPCEFIPFSTGPRKCIAFKSVMIELKVLVAYVLHNFEVQSEMTHEDLNKVMRKAVWPFPDLGIKIIPRH